MIWININYEQQADATARDIKRLANAGQDFAYFMVTLIRTTGKKAGPNPEAKLRSSWLEVIEHLGGGAKVVIGGKSMGGRMASMIADDLEVRGVVCLGYPFHPPGRGDCAHRRCPWQGLGTEHPRPRPLRSHEPLAGAL